MERVRAFQEEGRVTPVREAHLRLNMASEDVLEDLLGEPAVDPPAATEQSDPESSAGVCSPRPWV